jgi:hypothetical protein
MERNDNEVVLGRKVERAERTVRPQADDARAREYALKNNNWVWDDTNRQWKNNVSSKIQKNDDNVVIVNFKEPS